MTVGPSTFNTRMRSRSAQHNDAAMLSSGSSGRHRGKRAFWPSSTRWLRGPSIAMQLLLMAPRREGNRNVWPNRCLYPAPVRWPPLLRVTLRHTSPYSIKAHRARSCWIPAPVRSVRLRQISRVIPRRDIATADRRSGRGRGRSGRRKFPLAPPSINNRGDAKGSLSGSPSVHLSSQYTRLHHSALHAG